MNFVEEIAIDIPVSFNRRLSFIYDVIRLG